MLYIVLVVLITLTTTCVAVAYFYYLRQIAKKRQSMHIITPGEQMRLQLISRVGIVLVTAVTMSVLICLIGHS
jgi:Tfp pilus assembly protein PilX